MTEVFDQALLEGAQIAEWLETTKPKEIANADDRMVLASAFFLIAAEHHLAILRLFKQRLPSSAFALVRCLFDAYIRGEWAAKVATEEELDRFRQNKYDPSVDTIVKRLRQHSPEIGDPLELMKRLGWPRWSGFTHSGHAQLSNWVSEGALGPIHSEEMCVRAIKLATRFAFLAALSLVELAGAEPDRFFAKAREFGLLGEP